MSLFGSLMGGDMDDDMFMSNPMNAMNMQMRSMNRLMNSLMPDPFNMLTPFDAGFQQNALMERQQHMSPFGGLFGFPAMPNMNRLLNADINNPNGAAFCSSSVVSYTAGPDGRPQIYQATSSTKTGPGGVRETRKTVHDSTKGIKKMAIGHHIGERAHIIEKEQDINSGQLEERQEFVNLDEEEAEDFDREFTHKVRGSGARAAHHAGMLTIEPIDDDDDIEQSRHQQRHQRRQLPALPAPPTPQQNNGSTTAANSSSTVTITEVCDTDDDVVAVDATAGANMTNNNNNNYLHMNPRRHYRSHLSAVAAAASGGATPRRPLRTPISSPLATTMSSATITSPSVHHPHPYHTNASRRHHHHHQQQRSSKQAQKHHQQQQQQSAAAATVDLTVDDGACATEVAQQKKSKMSDK